jgi:glycosyltransferase involved in cell wall biosynthesis
VARLAVYLSAARMRILLINHYAGSKTHGMEYRPFYLAREWGKLGCETTIVAASFSHLRTTGPNVERSLAEELVENVPYIWLRTPAYRGNGVRRALNMFAFTAQLFRYGNYLAQKCHPDVVIATSTYPLANIPAYRIAKTSRAKLVYEVRDLWPLTLVELEGMPRWHPFILLMQWAENFSYRKANRVTCTLPNAASHMIQHGMRAEKFGYIPNGVAGDGWQENGSVLPEEHRNALSHLKAQGQFLLGYAGSHGISNALEFFIAAANLLQQQPVTFVFVGQGPEKGRLKQSASGYKLKNVIFLPPLPKRNVPAFFGLVDACFLSWQKRPIYRFGISPNKLLDYMMAGKPVLHAAEAPNDLVVESKCGFSVRAEDPRAIAAAVEKLVSLAPAEREAMGQRGRRYAQTHHDYSFLARQYLEILQ